jgi:hypothetical protein
MMARLRATFFFESLSYGWTETLFDPNGSHSLSDTQTLAGTLGALRVQMLGFGAALKEVRVSDDAIFRDSLVGEFSPDTSSIYTFPFNPANTTERWEATQPYADLLLRIEGGTRYRKSLYLSGIPGYLYTNPFPGEITDPRWQPLYNAWADELLRNWGFNVHQQPDAALPPIITFNPIFISFPDNLTALLTFTAAGFPTTWVSGEVVRIRGVRLTPATPRLSGNYKISAINSALFTVTLQAPGHINQTFNGTSKPMAWIDSQTVIAATSINQQNFTEHRRGRPFDSPRGRRRRT